MKHQKQIASQFFGSKNLSKLPKPFQDSLIQKKKERKAAWNLHLGIPCEFFLGKIITAWAFLRDRFWKKKSIRGLFIATPHLCTQRMSHHNRRLSWYFMLGYTKKAHTACRKRLAVAYKFWRLLSWRMTIISKTNTPFQKKGCCISGGHIFYDWNIATCLKGWQKADVFLTDVTIYPSKLIWNLKITPLKRKIIWTKLPWLWVPNVNFPGCNNRPPSWDIDGSLHQLLELRHQLCNVNHIAPSGGVMWTAKGFSEISSFQNGLFMAYKCRLRTT